MQCAADHHHHPRASDRSRVPAAQAPGSGPVVRRRGWAGARLLPRGDAGAVHRRAAARGRPDRPGPRPQGPGQGHRARPVRQRPAVRRLQHARGGDQGGLPHRAHRPLRRASRPGREPHSAGDKRPGPALPGRRDAGPPRLRAPRLDRRGDQKPPDPARVGRLPVPRPAADRRAPAGGRAQPPVRAAAGPRRRQALLGVHRGGGQADPGRRRLAGRAPGEGAHHPPLPQPPEKAHPVRAGPAGRSRRHRARGARQRGPGRTQGQAARGAAPRGHPGRAAASAAPGGSATSAAARARSPGTCCARPASTTSWRPTCPPGPCSWPPAT